MGDLAVQPGSASPGSIPGQGRFAPGSEEEARLRKLKSRDEEVRAHEQAHLAAAGNAAAGGASFTYEVGPDKKRYATGGEVKIKIDSGRTAEEKLVNARKAEEAALAPSRPSAQDLRVASSARRMQEEARSELAKESSGKAGDPAVAKATRAYKIAPAPTRGGFDAEG